MMGDELIQKLIPHRPPFLWVDEIIELEEGSRCVGLKQIGPDEDFFKGHFPGDPILPGVFIVEASAQVSGVMLASAKREETTGFSESKSDKRLAAINRFKFLVPVRPGDRMRIETKKVLEAGSMVYVEVEVRVGEAVVARGELSVLER